MSTENADVMKAIEDFKREMRVEMRSMNQGVKFCSDLAGDLKNALKELQTLTLEVKRTRDE